MITPKFMLDGYDAVVHVNDLPPAIVAHPSLRTFEYGGQHFARLPYNLPAVWTYRLAGLSLPSPIYTRYHWPKLQGLYSPREDQVDTAQFLTMNPRSFVLNEIGVGKTYSSLLAADYLMREGIVRRVLIVSPLSTLKSVWYNTIYSTFAGRSAAILHGTAKKRKQLLAQDHDFYIVNHHGVEVLVDKRYSGKGVLESVRLARDDIDLILIDELGAYRNGSNLRWAVMNKLIEHLRPTFLWGMTGTPIPEEPADAWAQIRLIRPDQVPRYFTVFKRTVMQQVSQYKWISLPDAAEKVFAVMRPAIRYVRDDVMDLPPLVYTDREAELSEEQRKLIKQMLSDLVLRMSSGEKITAINEAAKRVKLLQLACGVVYDDKGGTHTIDAGPRLNALAEICDEAAGKVIVFVPFTGALEMVAKFLRGKKRDVEVVHGQTPRTQRDEIFSRFQNTPSPNTLVADAGCMNYGLTLTEASTIVWYGPEDSNDVYEQANGRFTRMGQKHVATVVHLSSTSIEREVFRRTKQKGSLQGIMLALVHEEMKNL